MSDKKKILSKVRKNQKKSGNARKAIKDPATSQKIRQSLVTLEKSLEKVV
jgi:hypothetical protein